MDVPGELGLTEKEVVSDIITALTSNQLIAPSIWIDPNSGNNYFLTAMYKAGLYLVYGKRQPQELA